MFKKSRRRQVVYNKYCPNGSIAFILAKNIIIKPRTKALDPCPPYCLCKSSLVGFLRFSPNLYLNIFQKKVILKGKMGIYILIPLLFTVGLPALSKRRFQLSILLYACALYPDHRLGYAPF